MLPVNVRSDGACAAAAEVQPAVKGPVMVHAMASDASFAAVKP